MEKKLKHKFLPMEYSQTRFHRFKNLKQNLSIVEDLMKESYEFSICVEHQETYEKLATSCVKYLKFSTNMN